MPEIIKDAFVEGRETEIKWDTSKAKNNQLKLDVALENTSLMKKRQYFDMIPLHQICPTTGKVLNTFPSRIAAARFIVKDILKRPDKNPLAITGNMEMCMQAGWKAYGYYWKIASQASIDKEAKKTPNAKRIWVSYNGKAAVFNSLNAASDHLGISVDRIKNVLKSKTASIPKLVIQEYNATVRTLEFNSVVEAAVSAKVGYSTMSKWVKNNKNINNTFYVVDKPLKKVPIYSVFNNNKIIGKFTTAKEAAAVTGIHRTTLVKNAKSHVRWGNLNQYSAVIRYNE